MVGGRRAVKADTFPGWCLALLALGEGWHDDHHRTQRSSNQGFHCCGIDITYYLPIMMQWMRLVSDVRLPPAHVLERGPAPDAETVESMV